MFSHELFTIIPYFGSSQCFNINTRFIRKFRKLQVNFKGFWVNFLKIHSFHKLMSEFVVEHSFYCPVGFPFHNHISYIFPQTFTWLYYSHLQCIHSCLCFILFCFVRTKVICTNELWIVLLLPCTFKCAHKLCVNSDSRHAPFSHIPG